MSRGRRFIVVHEQARVRLGFANALRVIPDCRLAGGTGSVDAAITLARERDSAFVVVFEVDRRRVAVLEVDEDESVAPMPRGSLRLPPDDSGPAMREWATQVLVPWLRQYCFKAKRSTAPALPTQPEEPAAPVAVPRPLGKRPSLVAIAASTGGPDALLAVLGALPGNLATPVLVVQHMGAGFTDCLATRLDRHCALHVRLAEAGARPRAGEVWLAQGGHHMAIDRDSAGFVLSLSDEAPVHGCRPAADVTLNHLANCAPGRVLVVVLTGMGEDGARGALALAHTGCRVVAQDRETSVVWGMPGATVRLGAAHEQVPLPKIARRIATIAGSSPTLLGREPTRMKTGS